MLGWNTRSHDADDMLLFLSDPSQSIPMLLSVFPKFGEISGYKNNVQNGELMAVSSMFKQHITSNPLRSILKNKVFRFMGHI